MRTSIPGSLRPAWLLFGGLLIIFSAPQAARAQQPAADPATEFLIQCAQRYGLNPPGKPWRLKATFELLDPQGNTVDTGSIELLWASLFRYKQVYQSKSFSQTQYGVGTQVLFTGDPGAAPQSTFWLRVLFTQPIVDETVIRRSLVQFRGAAEGDGTVPGGPGCYDLRWQRQPDALKPLASYCFDERGTLLSYTVGFPRMGDATYEHPLVYDGHRLPGDVLMTRDGVPVLRAHLESVRWMSDEDQAEMQPPADAVPWHPPMAVMGTANGVGTPSPPAQSTPYPTNVNGQVVMSPPKKVLISGGVATGLLMSKVDPVYPAEAQKAHVSGTVVLQATINTEGRVEALQVVSGPPMLSQAAIDAVQQWRYRPYLLNGTPVEIKTIVNVEFPAPGPSGSSLQP